MIIQRFTSEGRKEQILWQFFKLAARGNYMRVTRREIARACDVSDTAISYHMGTMEELRWALIGWCVHQSMHGSPDEMAPVLAQAILDKHPATDALSKGRVDIIMRNSV